MLPLYVLIDRYFFCSFAACFRVDFRLLTAHIGNPSRLLPNVYTCTLYTRVYLYLVHVLGVIVPFLMVRAYREKALRPNRPLLILFLRGVLSGRCSSLTARSHRKPNHDYCRTIIVCMPVSYTHLTLPTIYSV